MFDGNILKAKYWKRRINVAKVCLKITIKIFDFFFTQHILSVLKKTTRIVFFLWYISHSNI